jgi:hypothetical protein
MHAFSEIGDNSRDIGDLDKALINRAGVIIVANVER